MNNRRHSFNMICALAICMAGCGKSFSIGVHGQFASNQAEGTGDPAKSLQTIPGKFEERAYGIVSLLDGGALIIAAAYTRGEVQVAHDLVIRLDADGTVIWQKSFGTVPDAVLYSGAEDRDGVIFLVGKITEPGKPDPDSWLLKIDAEGKVLGSRNFGVDGGDQFRSVAVTRRGDVLVGGWAWADGSRHPRARMIALDTADRPLWERYFQLSVRVVSGVMTNERGQIIVNGTCDGDEYQGTPRSSGWVAALAESGESLWEANLGKLGLVTRLGQWTTRVFEGRHGGYRIIGNIETTDPTRDNIQGWMVDLNASGEPLKEFDFGGPMYDRFDDGISMPNGDYRLCGNSEESAWLATVNAEGVLNSPELLVPGGFCAAIARLRSGRVLAAGDTINLSRADSDIWYQVK